ncbi:helix-turn-helix domain-containing protein [uncultured Bacteroides sp.]|uniref:winged helix-turn-helix transcriptional regulator n=1 Tax=uncultured Bacteroides sp. TaxID=162156 RepID=UPI002AA8E119|nr:helix-turn-helix domain-containing protein [uncultured Bacteroides sp.]
MKTEDRLKSDCPVRSILNGIGNKWSILIVDILGNIESLRFNELSKAVGDISQKMLTVTLRSLESDGVVYRKMYSEIPPHVEYGLTSLGYDLLPHIRSLIVWSKENIETIKINRNSFRNKKLKKEDTLSTI